jgi:hypothetical protein
MKTLIARAFTDPHTGREIRQLTDFEHGCRLGYFRMPSQVPAAGGVRRGHGGYIIAWSKHEEGSLILIDPEEGEYRPIPNAGLHLLKMHRGGKLYQYSAKTREIWLRELPDGELTFIGHVPPEIPGEIADITCDGKKLILLDTQQDYKHYPIPTTKDIDKLWHFFGRPRNGRIWVYDFEKREASKIYETDGFCPLHLDTHPSNPSLLRFCHDMYDAYGQRVWIIRTDGTGLRKVRPQERGELVTHEFWWSDDKHVGYTFQDRRADDQLGELPWAEYSPTPTHLGIADLHGREVFLSDPLNSYHTHLYMSPDGKWVFGEGTDWNYGVFLAPFDFKDTRVDLRKMASIHTPYVPFRGQSVNCVFSPDSRWLMYTDTVEGKLQVFGVRVEV